MAEPVQEAIQKKSLESVGAGGTDLKGQTAAEKFRKTMQEKGHRAVLEDARSGKKGMFGADRDRTVSQFASTAEQTTARDQIDTMNRFLTDGFDALPSTEQDDRVDEVVAAMLNSPVMKDTMLGLSPAEKDAYAKGLLQDRHFQAIVNQRMQKLSEREFKPEKSQIDNRIAVIRAANPTMDKATARTQALSELQTEFRTDLQNDLNNVIDHSAHALIRENLDAADEIVIQNAASLDQEVGDKMSEKIAEKFERRWSKTNPDAYRKDGSVRKDWDAFTGGGIDALSGISQADRDYLNANPDLKKKLEAQIGQSLILKRMRAGVLKKDDMYRLADAKWMGATPAERIDKIQETFEAHATLKDLIAQGQADGFIDKNVWDKIKAAGPYAAGGMLVALLALLAIPLAAAAPAISAVGLGAGAGAGGAAAGYAKYKTS